MCDYGCPEIAEEWRAVGGFPGYEVSNLGRVRSMAREVIDTWGRRYRRSTRVLTNVPVSGGYVHVPLYSIARTRPFTKKVHQLVATAFHGPRPLGPTVFEVRHLDGVPAHCCASNLAWGSHSENMRDTLVHGTNRNHAKTCCPRGHLLVGANIKPIRARSKVRECLACDRAKSRIYQRLLRAGRLAEYSVSAPEVVELADQYFAEIVLDSVKTLVFAQHIVRRFLPAALDSEGVAA